MSDKAFPNAYELVSDTNTHTAPKGLKGPYLGFVLHSDTVFDNIVAVGATYDATACLALIDDVPAGSFFPLRVVSYKLTSGGVKFALPG